MTKTTDSRQLRLLVDGILSLNGIDDLKLSIDLCEGVKKFWASETPVRTREDILSGIGKSLEKGAAKQLELEAIRNEIESRVHINPTTQEWIDFTEWAWKKKEEKGEEIGKFIDWWLSDDWRKQHPPFKPTGWLTSWPQAFVKTESIEYKKVVADEDDEKGVPNPFGRPKGLRPVVRPDRARSQSTVE